MANFNPIQVEKYLKGVDYPASKDDLLQCAKKNKADKDMYNLLQQLPARQFTRPTEVTHELSGLRHQ